MDTLEAFRSLDIRTGTITAVEDFPEAKKPLYKITVDFGPEIGQKTSGAGIKPYYTKDELVGKRVVGVINLPPKKIADFTSECLLLGAEDRASGGFALIAPDASIPDGKKVY